MTTVNDNATNSTSAGIPVIASPFNGGGMAASDPDADSVTYSLVNPDGSALADSSGTASALGPYDTGHGTVQLDSSGTYTYTPKPGFVGIDRFYYVASDGAMSSNVASISIRVYAGMPLLSVLDFDDAYDVGHPWTATWYDGPISQNIDTSLFQVLSQPTNGTLVDNHDGSVTFTAESTGPGSFTFGYGPDVPAATGADQDRRGRLRGFRHRDHSRPFSLP
jgi:hypothetical protein